jgi:hypothetical protein
LAICLYSSNENEEHKHVGADLHLIGSLLGSKRVGKVFCKSSPYWTIMRS